MIQKSVYFLILCLFFNPILSKYGVIPGAAKWVVEIIGISFIPIIFLNFAIGKRFYASRNYVILFIFIIAIVIVSSIYNSSDASALVVGLRHHFKYIPFFFLPIVYDFKEDEIKRILFLLLVVLLFQAPVTLIQRFFIFRNITTGDVVGGTVESSGIVSVLLVATISVCYSLSLAKEMKLRTMLTLSAILFIPTTINETKITSILLPLCLTISTLVSSDEHILAKVKKASIYIVVTIAFTSMFIVMYDRLYGDAHQSFFEYIQKEREGRGYLYYGETKASERIQANYRIGRFDSMMLAVNTISQDIGKLFFGVGVGNAITSKIGFLKTQGSELQKYFSDMTAVSNILWELGLSGVFAYFMFLFLIFKDVLTMKRQGDFMGAFCLSWCSVVVVMALALFYQNVFYVDAINITFWFLSGIVVAKTHRFQSCYSQQSPINPRLLAADATK